MKRAIITYRSEFPALEQSVNGHPLVYLDSAATALKPKPVIEALQKFYSFETANVHRGAHSLSAKATEKYEGARETIRAFLHAKSSSEIVFTRGATEGINLVAQTYGRAFLNEGDEILLTLMEHHSNIVPWQILAKEKNLTIRFANVLPSGELDMEQYRKLLTPKTKFVSVVHASNTLGTVNNIEQIVSMGHGVGAKVLVDAAQSATFHPLNVQNLKCDFLVFSGHKIYGPYGIGVLYAPIEILNAMPPYQGGGSMIDRVTVNGTTFLEAPQRFEAGTPNISGVIGLAEAIRFVHAVGSDQIEKHERSLVAELREELSTVEGIRWVGESPTSVNAVSFNLEGCHASDVGQILDQMGVAVRTGHHCTQPLMAHFGITGTVRVSFGVYNNDEDVNIFVRALRKAQRMLM